MSDPFTPPPARRPFHVSLVARLRAYFFTGIIVVAPIGLTVWLFYSAIAFVDRNMAMLVPEQYQPNVMFPRFGLPGLGVLVAVVALTAIGFLTTNLLGRSLLRVGEAIVDRMPVVRGIYSALKQIFETVLAQKSTSFRQVALVEFPKAGSWCVAFVTAEQTGEISRKLDDEMVGLFVPTTPNPTSGYLIYVARKNLVLMDMSVEDAMKLVISGGVIAPPDRF